MSFWREATLGYENWGGRSPRGNLGCGIGVSGLLGDAVPPHSRALSTAPSTCLAQCVLAGVVTTLFLSFPRSPGSPRPHKHGYQNPTEPMPFSLLSVTSILPFSRTCFPLTAEPRPQISAEPYFPQLALREAHSDWEAATKEKQQADTGFRPGNATTPLHKATAQKQYWSIS